jgi:hypothetical protein
MFPAASICNVRSMPFRSAVCNRLLSAASLQPTKTLCIPRPDLDPAKMLRDRWPAFFCWPGSRQQEYLFPVIVYCISAWWLSVQSSVTPELIVAPHAPAPQVQARYLHLGSSHKKIHLDHPEPAVTIPPTLSLPGQNVLTVNTGQTSPDRRQPNQN